jgi:hypothetical protein
MFEALVCITGGVLLAAMVGSYWRTRDPFHPLVYFVPMFLYIYVVMPARMLHQGSLHHFFPDLARLVYVQMMNLLGLGAFCVGCCWTILSRRGAPCQPRLVVLPAQVRRRMGTLGHWFGWIGLVAFSVMLAAAGGPYEAFSHPKGGAISSSASSGYLSCAVMLTIPALGLLMLAWQRQRFGPRHLALILAFASPYLLQGTLGARRGPAFLIAVPLFMFWYMVRGRRPQLWVAFSFLSVLGLGLFFLVTQRSEIYLGSDFDLDTSSLVDRVALSEHDPRQTEFAYGAGAILNAAYHGKYYWGRRYATILLVRPIPKQLWPSKYADFGIPEITSNQGLRGSEWLTSIGWLPTRGGATGFVADLFCEFSWGAIAFCFLLGRSYETLWSKAGSRGGLWIIAYVTAAAVSVFLATQSVAAAAYRFLFMMVPLVLVHQSGAWRVASSAPRRVPRATYGTRSVSCRLNPNVAKRQPKCHSECSEESRVSSGDPSLRSG